LTPPRPGPDWEAIGSALTPSPRRPLWRVFRDRLNQEWLLRHIEDRHFPAALKTDAYDEAVGEGVFPLLARVSDVVYETDVSATTCGLARKRYPALATAACDVRRLPFRSGSIDLVVSISTLDHFGDAASILVALRQLFNSLAPGGSLLITLDNLSNPLIRLRNSLPWALVKRFGLVPYPVGKTVTPARFRHMLLEVGFEVREVGTLLHALRVPAVAVASLLDRFDAPQFHALFVRVCTAFECLGSAATANWTANYIAAHAVKPRQSKGSNTSRSK